MGKKHNDGRKSNRDSIDYPEFLQMLTNEFPEVPQAFSEYEKGLLHCENGVFAQITKKAMDEGRLWQAEKYFRFIERVRENATEEVKDAVDVSYMEFLALSERTDNRYQAFKRMPQSLKAILLEIDGRRRWA
jgi:hypothetical protein